MANEPKGFRMEVGKLVSVVTAEGGKGAWTCGSAEGITGRIHECISKVEE